ncbi:MAG: DUF523 domain-containing protein [gamma proteobacterium symbiont of Bathyaustriella thionipta]|nr:DUF523 domain-containing protein [gamma proteobacterium symbiont of Bathyaustriella thionipta]
MTVSPARKPLIAVSACLLGQKVRYDGRCKPLPLLLQEWSALFDYYPLCPETGMGLGVPRPAVQLMGDIERPRVIGVQDTSLDITEDLYRYARTHVRNLPLLCGAVLKSASPSCGVRQVKLFSADGARMSRSGTGIYAREWMRQYPHLPIQDEQALQDAESRKQFVERVYACCASARD